METLTNVPILDSDHKLLRHGRELAVNNELLSPHWVEGAVLGRRLYLGPCELELHEGVHKVFWLLLR